MMKRILFALIALLLAAPAVWAQSDTTQPSLAEIARKVRAKRAQKDLSGVPMYTNDDVRGVKGPLSVFGEAGAPPAAAEGQEGQGQTAAAGASQGQQGEAAAEKKDCDETCWRQKFRDQRQKIAESEKELDILQREFNLSRVQYYQDPNQAVREQYSNNVAGGKELQDLQNRIDAKRQEIGDLRQGLSDLEDELRRAGGEPGWAREQ